MNWNEKYNKKTTDGSVFLSMAGYCRGLEHTLGVVFVHYRYEFSDQPQHIVFGRRKKPETLEYLKEGKKKARPNDGTCRRSALKSIHGWSS